MGILAVELGNCQLKLMEVSQKKNQLVMAQFSKLQTPEGSFLDGKILNKEALKKVLEPALKAYHAKKAVVILQSSQVLIRSIKLASYEEKVVRELIDLHIESYLPIKRAQYQVAYKKIGEVLEGNELKQEWLLVAMPNEIVLPLVDLMKALKKVPVLVTLPSEALSLSFKRGLIREEAEKVMVVDIGGKMTGLTILEKGQAVLTRLLPFGTLDLAGKLIENEAQGRGGLEESGLKQAIEKVLQFYETTLNGKEGIKKIYLVGGGAHLKGILTYITNAFHLPVEKLNEFHQVIEKKGFKNERSFFVNVLGGLCKKGEVINLLPKAFLRQQKLKQIFRIAWMSLVAEMILFAGGVVWPMHLNEVSSKNALLQSELALKESEWQTIKGKQDDVKQVQQAVQDLEAEYNALKTQTVVSVKDLDTLTACVPQGLNINELSMSDEEGLMIRGESASLETIYHYMGLLEARFKTAQITCQCTNLETTYHYELILTKEDSNETTN